MKMLKQVRVPPGQGLLGGVLLDLVVMGVSLMRYPALLNTQHVGSVIVVVALLLVYGGVGIGFSLRVHSAEGKNVLSVGTGMGLIVGFLFVSDITVEYFLDLSPTASMLSTLGFMGLIFCAFGVASAWGTFLTGRWLLGMLSSVWCAMQGVLIAVFFGVMVNFFFFQRLEHIFASEYGRSGMSDRSVFTFLNTFESAASHLLEAPLLAVVCGICGTLLLRGFLAVQGKYSRAARHKA